MKQFTCKFGYKYVILSSPTKSMKIHRLVALHFIDNPNNYSEIDHIDCDKTNNVYTNLEWVTRSENIARSFKNGLHEKDLKQLREKGLKGAKVLSKKVLCITNNLTFDSTMDAVRWLRKNIKKTANNASISNCCNGKSKTAYKMEWKFI